MSRAGFRRLERHVEDEYRRKGDSRARAAYIGRATAGEVATMRRERRRRGAVHKPPREQTHAERLRNLALARAARRRGRR